MAKKQSWFRTMLSGVNGDVSSKRFFGGGGLTLMHMIAIFSVIMYPESNWIGELLITLTVTDAGLLGVGIFEKEKLVRRKHHKENNNETDYTEEEYEQ